MVINSFIKSQKKVKIGMLKSKHKKIDQKILKQK